MSIEQEIEALEIEISQAEKSIASNEGKIEMAKEQLGELGLDSLKEAKAEMKALESQIEELDKDINVEFEKLKEDYEW